MAKKLLIISSRFPYPLEKGDKLRLYYQMKSLAKEFDVFLFCITEEIPSSSQLAEIKKICTDLRWSKLSKLTVALNLVKAFFKGGSYQEAYFYDRKAKRILDDFIEELKPDHLYCQLIRTGSYVSKSPIPKSLDFMDAFSYGMKKRASEYSFFMKSIFNRESKKIALLESDLFSKFNQSFVISDQDKERLNLGINLSVLNNGVDCNYFQSRRDSKPTYDIVFVGNLGYHPNIQAAKKIALEILPRYKSQHGIALSCNISGARPVPAVRALKNDQIFISGFVKDIRDAYESGKIMLAPIEGGMGQQNKILEAMAMGIPCIVSKEVAVALHAKHKEHLLIANTVDDYVRAIKLLIDSKELYQYLAEAGEGFVKANFDWDEVTKPLINAIKNS